MPDTARAMPPAAQTPVRTGGGLLDWLPWLMLGLSAVLMTVSVGGWLVARLRDGRLAAWWTTLRAIQRGRASRFANAGVPGEIDPTAPVRPAAHTFSALDSRIERLERVVAGLERAAAQLTRAGDAAAAQITAATQAGAAQARAQAPVSLSELKPPAGDARAPAAATRQLEQDGAIDPLLTSVYRLSDQGLPPVEIARSLGQHTGKVELILALRRR